MSFALNRKNNIRLVKDLKSCQAHLRQSLIQENQIENINKIYEGRKQHYEIQTRELQQVKKKQIQINPQIELCQHITPMERVQMLRKQKLNIKRKEKMKAYEKKQPTIKPKIKQFALHKLLQQFKNNIKNDLPPNFFHQLKISQTNLQNVKINSRKKSLLNVTDINDSRINRSKMISLQTSLPQNIKYQYPSITDILKGKSMDHQKKKYYFDVQHIQKKLDQVYPQSKYKSQEKVTIQEEKKTFRKGKNIRNAFTSLNKSFKSSKNIIFQMSQYYQTKTIKKKQCDQILDILKHDRPVTSSIRRKNYQIIGSQHLNQVKVYRNIAELERRQILKKNYEFYISLLNILQSKYYKELKASIIICQGLKEIFQSEYELNRKAFNEILNNIKKEQFDQMTDHIIEKVLEFISENHILSTE